MKIAIIGYGRMGKEIEEMAAEMQHEKSFLPLGQLAALYSIQASAQLIPSLGNLPVTCIGPTLRKDHTRKKLFRKDLFSASMT